MRPARLLLAAFLLLLFLATSPLHAQGVWVEAEGFDQTGGWLTDQQSMDTMGSPYLLAHGLGQPVADATTNVPTSAATYRVWVRTKDWVARWDAPGTPGRFQVLIDGKPLAETFGTKGVDWSWHDGGTVELDARSITLSLHDLTGFEGRCDSILLADDLDFVPPNDVEAIVALRNKLTGRSLEPADGGEYDLVVVGGGVPGCCAAVAAARFGMSVALVQDRPVLGGNSSSEVRVWISGRFQVQPYPIIGEILAEFFTRPKVCPDKAEAYGDDRKLKVVTGEENVKLFLGEHVNAAEMDDGSIRSVVAENIATGQKTRFRGRWFVDCTGDGTLGLLSGADSEVTEKGHLGASNLWAPEETDEPVAFPECPWAIDLTDKPFPTDLKRLGKWFWESGFDLDTVADAEAIRDHNLRAMYGAWDSIKNDKGLYPNHRLAWAAAISGKRESRRLLGDVVLTQEDVVEGREFPDGCVGCTWSIDLHYPNPAYVASCPENPFLSHATFLRFQKNPYPLPLRCLYSRNVPNLMMAGRDISVTHEALGTVRVMATGGMMGEVLGRAAHLCKKHDCNPRDVYADHLDEFLALCETPTRTHVLDPPEFVDEVGANLARQATLSTSAETTEGYSLSAINDGAANTFDNRARWLGKPLPGWVEFRFEQPVTITAARIISGFHSGGSLSAPLEDFTFQIPDGDAWQDIPQAKVTANELNDWQARFAPVTADRFRLNVTSVLGDVIRLWEVELYAPSGTGNGVDQH